MIEAAGRRVVVVTGGGAGIGAGVAEAVGRTGAFVVTLDANVSLDGADSEVIAGPTTAERIVADGGAARAVNLSVTDAAGVSDLFGQLVAEHGSLDAVVNVAGISRPTSFATGSAADWRAVLDVHLEGFLTVLRAALPIMADAGHGRIVGVTSGSGWRPANAGAYGCAKRAVASLVWQLGANPPPGVTVNALSPIAATRMVTAALQRPPASGAPSGSSASGGITLTGFPPPEVLGPVGAHVASEEFAWCSGRVLFTAGAELAVVQPPRVLEAIRTRPAQSVPRTLAELMPAAFVPAEAGQTTGGGSIARFAQAFEEPAAEAPNGEGSRCLVVADDPTRAAELIAALVARGTTCTTDGGAADASFSSAAERVAAADAELGGVDAVVVAVGSRTLSDGSVWEQILADHEGLPGMILSDAAWMRAVADHSAATGARIRFVGLIGATTPGGRSRAQGAAQLARAARDATGDVAAAVVSCESERDDDATAAVDLATHLVVGHDTAELSGAELCVGDGWIAIRSHPTPSGTVNFGGPEVPTWVDGALRAVLDVG